MHFFPLFRYHIKVLIILAGKINSLKTQISLTHCIDDIHAVVINWQK